MTEIIPSWVSGFRCIADQCRHSCCIGWEIDIDAGSAQAYQTRTDALGQRLRASMVRDEAGTFSFRLDEQERCPFLNRQGLCDLILEAGEGSLCQICRDHPRYRTEFLAFTEVGLGLCCEEACRELLFRQAPLTPELPEDLALSEDEQAFLSLRSRLLALIQDRQLTMSQRVEQLCRATSIPLPEFDRTAMAGFLLELEQLDPAWGSWLNQWKTLTPTEQPSCLELPLEQLLTCLLLRHFSKAWEEGGEQEYLQFCLLCWAILRDMLCCLPKLTRETIIDTVRMFSSEIEYSQENTDALLDLFF